LKLLLITPLLEKAIFTFLFGDDVFTSAKAQGLRRKSSVGMNEVTSIYTGQAKRG